MKKCVLCQRGNFDALFSVNGFIVEKCSNCGLVRTRNFKQPDYSKYHRDTDYISFEKHFGNIFQKRVNIAEQFLKKSGRVLEVGASTGIMLSLFKKRGWEAWGVEPSESGNVATEKGIRIIKDEFEKAHLPPTYFDLAILNHTLEHMQDPFFVLTKIYKLLKNGGYVAVDVPNFGSLPSLLYKENWKYLLPDEHVHHFTQDSLGKLMQKAGFFVVHFESRSGIWEYSSPLADMWDAFVNKKKRLFVDIASLPVDTISTLINRGESMTMVAKKDE